MRYVWLNGTLQEAEALHLDPRDRGLLLGDGLFETIAAEQGAPLFFARHWRRLRAGAALLGIPLPWGAQAVLRACRALLAANDLARRPAALRLTLTRGPGPRGLLPPRNPRPTLLLAAFPRDPAPPPARALLVETPRRNDRSPLSRIKSLSALDAVLARRQAERAGVEEALLLNTQDRLACAAAANLFLVCGGVLCTPPLAEGVLAGITRERVLEAAAALGLACAERPLHPAALGEAEEAFLTNSLIGIRPLVAVDGRPLGRGREGEVTRTLRRALARPG